MLISDGTEDDDDLALYQAEGDDIDNLDLDGDREEFVIVREHDNFVAQCSCIVQVSRTCLSLGLGILSPLPVHRYVQI